MSGMGPEKQGVKVIDEQTLLKAMAFCRIVYYMGFSSVEAEEHLKQLRVEDVMQLWEQAGPKAQHRLN